MNTIPTTSKQTKISYTVLGGQTASGSRGAIAFTLLVLNRGKSIFKSDFFKEIEHMGFGSVISIENPGVNYDIEAVSRKFPFVKFFLLQENCTPGEQINIGIEEAPTAYVYVVWNDMKLLQHSVSLWLYDHLEKDDAICTFPILKTIENTHVPSLSAPTFNKKKNLKVIYAIPKRSGISTLFPFDYCGIYHRERFLYSGGYDNSILNRYWQKMDYGFRVNMWGEKIVCNTTIQLTYTSDILAEDTSIDKYYRFFYLKNLAVKFNEDSGYLPGSEFFIYLFSSREGFFNAKRSFAEAKKWIDLNKFRFNTDSRGLTELWEDPEE